MTFARAAIFVLEARALVSIVARDDHPVADCRDLLTKEIRNDGATFQ